MALSEIQLPTKTDLYQSVRAIATEMKRVMLRWNEASEFLATVETADLDSLGVPAGQVRTDLDEFRTALDEVIALFEGASVVPTNNPEIVMDKFRQMMVV